MSNPGALAGAVALITGASSGIGEAAARHLAGLGADVALVARIGPSSITPALAFSESLRVPVNEILVRPTEQEQ